MKKLVYILVPLALSATMGLTACMTQQEAGSLIGGITGGVVGAQIGKGTGSKWTSKTNGKCSAHSIIMTLMRQRAGVIPAMAMSIISRQQPRLALAGNTRLRQSSTVNKKQFMAQPAVVLTVNGGQVELIYTAL